MSNLLHTDFLTSDTAFAACQKYWVDLFRNTLTKAGHDADEWESWLPSQFGNGTPMDREDLPVLERRSARLNRAIRVLQWQARPEQQSGILSGSITDYEREGFDSTFPQYELVLNLTLDSDVARLAAHAISMWAAPNLEVEQMQQFLREQMLRNHQQQ